MKDSIDSHLKRIGLKITPQRQAIFNLLKGNPTHPSAEKIYSEISRKYHGLSFATVYNTLSKLVEAGEIQELDIDPDKKRFDPCITPHPHFFCKVCGEIFDLTYDPFFNLNLKKIGGHQVDSLQLNVKGVCKDCRK
jgi:Fur family peroxide stress response transcriptional regulator